MRGPLGGMHKIDIFEIFYLKFSFKLLIFEKDLIDMNIQAEKLGLIEWIAKLNDSSIIEKLRIIKNDYIKTIDWWDELSREEIASIERGLKDIEEGRVHSHETAKKLYEKYL